MNLDVKEAYEFSVHNPFFINEEELNSLLASFNEQQYTSNSDIGGGGIRMNFEEGVLQDDSSDEDGSKGKRSAAAPQISQTMMRIL